MNLRPIYNRIVAKRTKVETFSAGGIILQLEEANTETEAVVIAVGPDVTVIPGDRILFGNKVGTDVKVDGEPVVVLTEDDVIAVVS